MEYREKVCRFCLERCDINFKAIERSTHEILNMLLVTMNLAISEEPVMCTNCSEILQNCFVFKKTYLDIQDRNGSINGHAVCEFCMNQNGSIAKLETEDNIILERTMLEKYFPELNLSASKKPVICEVCRGSLVNFFDFVTTCSIVEEKIKEYREAGGVNDRDPIKLNDVLQFTSGNVWKENDNKLDVFKMEDTISIETENEKMKIQGEICTLCLEKCEAFKAIDENTKNILDIVLPEMDVTVIKGPVVCKTCEEMLIKCFKFKATCLHTHNYIVPFLNNKDDVKLDLTDVYLRNGTDSVPGQEICGLCMGLVENYSAVYLDVEKGDVILEKIIEKCLPELDLNIVEKPVICATCHVSLEDCFHFVTSCLIVEGKIKKYCESSHVNRKDQIELSNLLQFTITREVDGNSANKIKVEEQFCDEREIENGGATVKLEPIFFDDSEDVIEDDQNKNNSFTEMNDQEVNNDQQFTPKNMLADAGESNKFGSVKIEGIFFEESDTKHEEKNRVEMGDQKFLFNEEIEIKTEERDIDRFKDGMLNLEREQHALTEKHVSKIRMFQRELRSFQTRWKKSLVNHNLILKGSKKHLLTHKDPSNITVYKCDCCLYQTKQKNDLKRHLNLHRNPSEATMYNCDLCSFQTKHKQCLNIHLLRHKDASEVIMYDCDSCSFRTRYKYQLKSHLLTHKDPSEVRMHKCVYCSFETKRKSTLNEHALKHKDPSEVTMYKCDLCPFQTKYKSNLKGHLLKHKDPSEVTMYKCDYCSFETKRKDTLNEHLLKHKDSSEVTMYKCDLCPFQTKYKGYLKGHLLTHKDPSEVTMYKCDFCPFETKRRGTLNEHVLKHKDPSEVTMYKCNLCQFHTKHKGYLKHHLLTHKDPSEVTMHKCDFCPFETKRKGTLKEHVLKHKDPSEVTMYKCDLCPFQTKCKGYLKNHLLKHKDPSEITMYKCDFCPFETKRKCYLKNHLITHKDPSEVTMYKCDACSYQSKQKQDIKKHQITHKDPSELSMYKCDYCPFQTKCRNHLKKHVILHENLTDVTVPKQHTEGESTLDAPIKRECVTYEECPTNPYLYQPGQ